MRGGQRRVFRFLRSKAEQNNGVQPLRKTDVSAAEPKHLFAEGAAVGAARTYIWRDLNSPHAPYLIASVI